MSSSSESSMISLGKAVVWERGKLSVSAEGISLGGAGGMACVVPDGVVEFAGLLVVLLVPALVNSMVVVGQPKSLCSNLAKTFPEFIGGKWHRVSSILSSSI